jgi:hypothetical protein
MVTAILFDDAEAFDFVLDGHPPLPYVLADALVLLRDAALASTSLAIHRQADDVDLRRAWEDCRPALATTLARLHGYSEADVAEWEPWAEAVLTEGDFSIPAHSQATFLALTVALTAELFAGYSPETWQGFLIARAGRGT